MEGGLSRRLIFYAYTAFISSGTIKKLNTTVEIDRQIGRKYFRKTAQIVYQKKNEQFTDNELEKLEFVFQDFPSVVSELTTDEDIAILRKLEKEKQIDVATLVSGRTTRSKYRNKPINDDLFWLYYVPRHEVLENIEMLKEYDEEDELAKRHEIETQYANKQNKRDEIFNKIYCMGQNLLDKSIKEFGIGEIKIDFVLPRNNQVMGYIRPKTLEWTDTGFLNLVGDELNLKIPIYNYEVFPDLNQMTLFSYTMQLTFSIDKSLNETIEMLELYKDKKLNEIQQNY